MTYKQISKNDKMINMKKAVLEQINTSCINIKIENEMRGRFICVMNLVFIKMRILMKSNS
jgi:hypothetical protein